MDGERRTAVGHHVFQSALVHGNHVGIALDHKHAVFLGNGFLRLEEAVELTLLVVELRVGRVHVFLLHTLRTGIEQSSAKGHHPTTHVQPGEDHAPAIAVVESFLALDAKTRLLQELRLIARFLGRHGQCVALGQGITQVELLDDIVADASATEVLFADGNAVGVVLQHLLEVLQGPLVHCQHRLTVALMLFLLVGQFPLLDLDIILLRQPAQGLGIGYLLVLHQEVDGRTALTTSKALADLLRGRHHERRCRIVVEGAQALVVHARLT